jgi:hypothetical protein
VVVGPAVGEKGGQEDRCFQIQSILEFLFFIIVRLNDIKNQEIHRCLAQPVPVPKPEHQLAISWTLPLDAFPFQYQRSLAVFCRTSILLARLMASIVCISDGQCLHALLLASSSHLCIYSDLCTNRQQKRLLVRLTPTEQLSGQAKQKWLPRGTVALGWVFQRASHLSQPK